MANFIRHLTKPKMAIAVIVLAAAGYAGYSYFSAAAPAADAGPGRTGRGGGANRPQPVSVAEVKTADMPIWIAALGTAVPRNLVTVHTRVDGELLSVQFREGQMVTQGQLLAEIDPRPYQVQLAQANGQLARDAAQLKNAEIDFERYRELWAKDSIAKQQVDTQEALVRQYRGTVEADQGQVDSAKLQLTYAHITAPISGRVGLRPVDAGNQVHASDANGLAVIAQLQPMTVVFSVPESNLPALNRRLSSGQAVVVEAWDREQKNRLANGRLLTVDNLVDPATGTVKLKAEFANADNALFPNQFTNVRLLLGTLKDSLVVPSAAVLRGSGGAFVYSVDAEGTVGVVPVVPGPTNGDVVAVEGKLTAGTRVVADGGDKLRDGAKVEVITAEARSGAADGKPGARGKRRPEGGPPAAAN